MNVLQPPAATGFDAFAGVASLALYLIVGIAAFIASHETRARVFLVIAIASVMPYLLPALIWLKGGPLAYRPEVIVGTVLSVAVGSPALFHFTQVFPARRPWIRAHGVWLFFGYAAIVLLIVIVAAWALPLLRVLPEAAGTDAGGIGAVSIGIGPIEALVVLAVLLPSV